MESREPIHDHGTGVYLLDDANVVHLDRTSKQGWPRHVSGPIPALRSHAGLRLAICGYVLVVCAGIAIGVLIAHGNSSDRAGAGPLGALAAVFTLWIVGMATTARRSRNATRAAKRASNCPP